MTWGFAPGSGLREAYKDFLLKPDEVKLTMTPSKEFNPLKIDLKSVLKNISFFKASGTIITITTNC